MLNQPCVEVTIKECDGEFCVTLHERYGPEDWDISTPAEISAGRDRDVAIILAAKRLRVLAGRLEVKVARSGDLITVGKV